MFRRIALAFAAVSILTACDASDPVAPNEPAPPPPAPLQLGTWELSSADGLPLPAIIAHRMVNNRLEQVLVDSARITVLEGGRFEQRIWMRTFRDGALQFRDTWVDAGRWQVNGSEYAFESNGGARLLSVRTAISPVLRVTERMVSWPGAGLVVGTYARRLPNPGEIPQEPGTPPLTQTIFRATDVAGVQLPARVITERDVPHRGAETYTQLDSAWVALNSDGRYTRRAFYTTWTSPNVEFSLGYTKVGFYRDYDLGRWTRTGNQLALASTYFQNRGATGIWSGDRLRLRQDMSTNDVFVDVGYSVSTVPVDQ